MKLETYINVHGFSGDMTYGIESKLKTEVDEDFDEYISRVHGDVDETFGYIKRKEKERKNL